jgi:hypothetical protein
MRFAPSAELAPRRSFLLRLGAGLSLLALAVVAAAPLRGVEVSWPLLAFAGFGAGNAWYCRGRAATDRGSSAPTGSSRAPPL